MRLIEWARFIDATIPALMKPAFRLMTLCAVLAAGLAPAAAIAAPDKKPPAPDARLSTITAHLKSVLAAPFDHKADAGAASPLDLQTAQMGPPLNLQGWYYDAGKRWGIHSERQLQDQAYELLDDDEAEESRLAGIADLIRQLPEPDAMAGARFGALCGQLLERVEFMDGLFRVEIGRRLAASDRSSYSFQAVQSGIDTLDRAITMRTTGENRGPKSGADQAQEGAPDGAATALMPVSEMRQIRNAIFTAWDRARSTGSPAPLAALSLSPIIQSAEATVARDPASRAWTALRCFAWLDPPAAKPAGGP